MIMALDFINDPLSAVIALLIAVATGGVGAAIVNAIVTSRRGIRGDALTKEQNGITGLSNLADRQDNFIKSLEARIEATETELEAVTKEFTEKLSDLTKKLAAEIEYSNSLMVTLNSHNIPIPPRKEQS